MTKTSSAVPLPCAAWQVQEAKARFSELCGRAWREGPQRVTRQGRHGVVILSDDDFERLRTGRSTAKRQENLFAFLRGSPLYNSGIDLDRDRDTGRDIDL